MALRWLPGGAIAPPRKYGTRAPPRAGFDHQLPSVTVNPPKHELQEESMTHPYYHAQSSARLWGGAEHDYVDLHAYLDRYKHSYCDYRHRLMTHHAEGITDAEEKFGLTITLSTGKQVPVRYILEQHIREDCGGRVPNLSDWLQHVTPQPWMARAFPLFGKGARDAK